MYNIKYIISIYEFIVYQYQFVPIVCKGVGVFQVQSFKGINHIHTNFLD